MAKSTMLLMDIAASILANTNCKTKQKKLGVVTNMLATVNSLSAFERG
jgi:hypothetical protein